MVEKSAPALHSTAPQTRARRAESATVGVHLQFTGKQQAFVDFVLAQYVEQGVGGTGHRQAVAAAQAALAQRDG